MIIEEGTNWVTSKSIIESEAAYRSLKNITSLFF